MAYKTYRRRQVTLELIPRWQVLDHRGLARRLEAFWSRLLRKECWLLAKTILRLQWESRKLRMTWERRSKLVWPRERPKESKVNLSILLMRLSARVVLRKCKSFWNELWVQWRRKRLCKLSLWQCLALVSSLTSRSCSTSLRSSPCYRYCRSQSCTSTQKATKASIQ